MGLQPLSQLAIQLAVVQLTAFASAFGSRPHQSFDPTWSLTVEWTFYLVFPLVLGFVRRKAFGAPIAKVLAGIAVILYAVGLPMSFEAFYLLSGREPRRDVCRCSPGSMALGAHRATVLRSRPHRNGHGNAWRPRGTARLHAQLVVEVRRYASGGSCGAGADPRCGGRRQGYRCLGNTLVSGVGRGAYSLYLWHMPVMWLVWFNTQGANKWLQAAIACLGTAGVSALSYRALERPVLLNGDARSPSLGSRFAGSSRHASPSNARL